MKNTQMYRIAGIVLIVACLAAMGGQLSIMTNFDWEGRSFSEVLVMYHNGGAILKLSWSIFLVGALLMIPSALLLHKVFFRKQTPFLYIGTTFGVIAGMSYVIGIMRWILLASALSAAYVAPTAAESAKETIEIVFQAFNVYAGNSFGETLAPITHAIWLVMLGFAMLKSPICGRWLAVAQILCGIVIAWRPLEYVGLKTLASISDIGILLWTLMLFVFGIVLLRAKDENNIGEI